MFSKAFPEMVALFQQLAKGKEKQKHRKKGLKFTPVHNHIIADRRFCLMGFLLCCTSKYS